MGYLACQVLVKTFHYAVLIPAPQSTTDHPAFNCKGALTKLVGAIKAIKAPLRGCVFEGPLLGSHEQLSPTCSVSGPRPIEGAPRSPRLETKEPRS